MQRIANWFRPAEPPADFWVKEMTWDGLRVRILQYPHASGHHGFLIILGSAHGGPTEYCDIAFIQGVELSGALHLLEQAADFVGTEVAKQFAHQYED